MSTQVEYVAHTRIGEKGQLTIPKEYRDDLGLNTGAPMAVLRIGDGLMLIPEQNRFRMLCDSISSALKRQGVGADDLVETLPAARERVYTRRYPTLTEQQSR